jgi:cellulose biosynthesis protein BcsQ
MRTSVIPSCGAKLPPYVVVIGNQKGGRGKSAFAMHIIVALLKAGKRVASFDLDLNQLTTRSKDYLSNNCQSKFDQADAPSRRENGYRCLGADRLIFDQYH